MNELITNVFVEQPGYTVSVKCHEILIWGNMAPCANFVHVGEVSLLMMKFLKKIINNICYCTAQANYKEITFHRAPAVNPTQ